MITHRILVGNWKQLTMAAVKPFQSASNSNMEATSSNNRELDSESTLGALPEELRSQIFGCLEPADLASVAQGKLLFFLWATSETFLDCPLHQTVTLNVQVSCSCSLCFSSHSWWHFLRSAKTYTDLHLQLQDHCLQYRNTPGSNYLSASQATWQLCMHW